MKKNYSGGYSRETVVNVLIAFEAIKQFYFSLKSSDNEDSKKKVDQINNSHHVLDTISTLMGSNPFKLLNKQEIERNIFIRVNDLDKSLPSNRLHANAQESETKIKKTISSAIIKIQKQPSIFIRELQATTRAHLNPTTKAKSSNLNEASVQSSLFLKTGNTGHRATALNQAYEDIIKNWGELSKLNHKMQTSSQHHKKSKALGTPLESILEAGTAFQVDSTLDSFIPPKEIDNSKLSEEIIPIVDEQPATGSNSSSQTESESNITTSEENSEESDSDPGESESLYFHDLVFPHVKKSSHNEGIKPPVEEALPANNDQGSSSESESNLEKLTDNNSLKENMSFEHKTSEERSSSEETMPATVVEELPVKVNDERQSVSESSTAGSESSSEDLNDNNAKNEDKQPDNGTSNDKDENSSEIKLEHNDLFSASDDGLTSKKGPNNESSSSSLNRSSSGLSRSSRVALNEETKNAVLVFFSALQDYIVKTNWGIRKPGGGEKIELITTTEGKKEIFATNKVPSHVKEQLEEMQTLKYKLNNQEASYPDLLQALNNLLITIPQSGRLKTPLINLPFFKNPTAQEYYKDCLDRNIIDTVMKKSDNPDKMQIIETLKTISTGFKVNYSAIKP